MSTEKLIEKIQKLLTLARNDGASEHEADTAMQMANKLLLIHNLSMSDVDVSQEDGDGLIQKNDIITIGSNSEEGQWESNLMAVICEYNLCGCIVHSIKGQHQSTMTVIGSKENVEIVLFLFNIARELYRDFSKKRHSAYRKSVLDEWKSRGYIEKDLYVMEKEDGSRMLLRRSVWIRSYLKGCVLGLLHKLETQHRELQQKEKYKILKQREDDGIQSTLKAEAQGKMELMIIDVKRKIEQKIESEFDNDSEVEFREERKWKVDPASDAFQKGAVDGKKTNLVRALN